MSKHSIERIQERYNIELSDNDNKYLLSMINSGRFLSLLNKNNDKNKRCAYIKYRKIPLRIVYVVNKNGYAIEIVTALPFDVDEYNQLVEQEILKDINWCIAFLRQNNYIVYKKPTQKG